MPRPNHPFAVLVIVPVSLTLISFFVYRGPKVVHWLQVPGTACLLWTGFARAMPVTCRFSADQFRLWKWLWGEALAQCDDPLTYWGAFGNLHDPEVQNELGKNWHYSNRVNLASCPQVMYHQRDNEDCRDELPGW
jgi:hypothetical protein